MNELTVEEIILKSDAYSAGIVPAYGGVLSFLRHGDTNILRPASSIAALKDDPRNGACFPCIPYFGRLYGGLTMHDRHWKQSPTLPACDNEHALHGEGWVSPWKVIEQGPDQVTMVLNYEPRNAGRYPLPYRAALSLSLSGSGASFAMSLTNTGVTPMPAGMGLHPYFEKSPSTKIFFAADERWAPPKGSANAKPFGSEAASEYVKGAALPRTTIDDSYSGFTGSVEVLTAAGSIFLTTSAEILHLYAPDDEDFFCMEPVTHLPGAFSDRVSPAHIPAPMAAGDTRSVVMAISV